MKTTKEILSEGKYVYLMILALSLYAFSIPIDKQFHFIGNTPTTIIEFITLLSFIYFAVKTINEFEFENKYFKFIFICFMLYQLFLFIRGAEFSYSEFRKYLNRDFLLWPSLLPFFIFFNKKNNQIFHFVKAIYYLTVIYVVISIVDPFLLIKRITAEPFILPFAFTTGFLFMNNQYFSKKINWLSFFTLMISLLSVIYLARRNVIVSFGMLILVGLYFILRQLNAARILRLLPVFIGITIMVLFINDITPASLTSNLSDRLTSDTRTTVFDNYFASMKDDMIFGKGFNGRYYSPIDEMITEDGVKFDSVDERDIIENGYLQMMLSGGYINVILFILITIPALLLGLFKTSNHFTRVCALVIFLWMIDMAIFGLPRLLLEFILFWISIGICYSESFRDLSDEDIARGLKEVGFS